jgi:hypothetical protein
MPITAPRKLKAELKLRIVVSKASGVDLHQVRNFGEALWRSLCEERRALVDLDEVDRAIDETAVDVHPASRSNSRWVEKHIQSVL